MPQATNVSSSAQPIITAAPAPNTPTALVTPTSTVSRLFEGEDRVIDLLNSANGLTGDEFEAVEATTDSLKDWFLLKNEHFTVPKEFGSTRTIACRVFKFHNADVGQVMAKDNRELLYFLFNPNDLGVRLEKGKWKIVEGERLVAGVTVTEGTCFMVAFRGKSDDMKVFLASKISASPTTTFVSPSPIRPTANVESNVVGQSTPDKSASDQTALVLRILRTMETHDYRTMLNYTVDGHSDYFGHKSATHIFIQKDMEQDVRSYKSCSFVPDLSTFKTKVDSHSGLTLDSVEFDSDAIETHGKEHKARCRLEISYRATEPIAIYSLSLEVMHQAAVPANYSTLIVGKWRSPRHDYIYYSDGTWRMAPPATTHGTWHIEGKTLYESTPIENGEKIEESYEIVSLTSEKLVFKTPGTTFEMERIK
jgi:hypothetical protein